MKNQRSGTGSSARPLSRLPALLLTVLLPSTLLHAAGSTSLALPGAAGPSDGTAVFNVRDFGATGRKLDFAGRAIQKAVEACAAAGGGMVYVPPGDYTSGTIHLRSHVRFFVEGGATIHSSKDKAAFDKDAMFFGEDLVNVTLEGRGTVDGEAAYEHRPCPLLHRQYRRPGAGLCIHSSPRCLRPGRGLGRRRPCGELRQNPPGRRSGRAVPAPLHA